MSLLDTPLTDVPFYAAALARAATLADAAAQQRAIDALDGWDDAGPGGTYDALGDLSHASRRVVMRRRRRVRPRAVPYAERRRVPAQRERARHLQRVAFVLYDSNLTLAWDRLRPDADYLL